MNKLSDDIIAGWKRQKPFPLTSWPGLSIRPHYIIADNQLYELISEIQQLRAAINNDK